jgi:hypothetical protein
MSSAGPAPSPRPCLINKRTQFGDLCCAASGRAARDQSAAGKRPEADGGGIELPVQSVLDARQFGRTETVRLVSQIRVGERLE